MNLLRTFIGFLSMALVACGRAAPSSEPDNIPLFSTDNRSSTLSGAPSGSFPLSHTLNDYFITFSWPAQSGATGYLLYGKSRPIAGGEWTPYYSQPQVNCASPSTCSLGLSKGYKYHFYLAALKGQQALAFSYEDELRLSASTATASATPVPAPTATVYTCDAFVQWALHQAGSTAITWKSQLPAQSITICKTGQSSISMNEACTDAAYRLISGYGTQKGLNDYLSGAHGTAWSGGYFYTPVIGCGTLSSSDYLSDGTLSHSYYKDAYNVSSCIATFYSAGGRCGRQFN